MMMMNISDSTTAVSPLTIVDSPVTPSTSTSSNRVVKNEFAAFFEVMKNINGNKEDNQQFGMESMVRVKTETQDRNTKLFIETKG